MSKFITMIIRISNHGSFNSFASLSSNDRLDSLDSFNSLDSLDSLVARVDCWVLSSGSKARFTFSLVSQRIILHDACCYYSIFRFLWTWFWEDWCMNEYYLECTWHAFARKNAFEIFHLIFFQIFPVHKKVQSVQKWFCSRKK